MAEEKVYHPEEIIETPFPNQAAEATILSEERLPAGTYAPTTVKDKPFPKKRVAVELLSSALNTRSRKILQEFDLQQSGGLKIGDFKEGVSGDLRITPNGLTARDVAGITTFAIDGTTGDAVFKGTVQAGSIINEGELVDKNGNVIINEDGILSVENFASSSATQAALNQSIASGSRTDITGASHNVSFENDVIVLLIADLRVYTYQTSGSGDWDATGVINFDIDGTEKDGAIRTQGVYNSTTGDRSGSADRMTSVSMHRIETLIAGQHTIKLQAYLSATNNNGALNIYNYKYSYLTLGK